MSGRGLTLVKSRVDTRGLWLDDRLAEVKRGERDEEGLLGVNDVSLSVTRIGFLQMSVRKPPSS